MALIGDPCLSQTDIRLVKIVPNEVPAGPDSRHGGGAGTSEGVQHKVSPVCVQLYQAGRKFDRKWGRMTDPTPMATGGELFPSPELLGRTVPC